jgi:aubergine
MKLQEEIARVFKGDNFRMSFIIVSKRINTRVFHREDNPPPGTVVDDCITLPER